MKFEWQDLTLGDIVETVIDHRGKTPKKLGGDWSDTGYRAFSAKNIKTGQIVQCESIRFVDEAMYHKWMKEEIQRGDILITSEAPFGQIFYWDSDEKIVLSQRLFGVRIKKQYDPRFIYYYMTTNEFQSEMDHRATGTTVVGLRQPELMKCALRCPDYETQRKISAILTAIDNKIAVNEAINHNLQQQFQALFDSWFKRFEPFSQPKYESELGLIPEGWSVKDIYSISSIIYGAPFSSKLFNDEHKGSPIVRIRDLKTQNTSTYTTEIHPKGYLIQNGDIIVGMDGEFRPYIWGSGEAWLNQRVCVFENKRPKGKVFLFCSIKPLLNLIEQTEVATTVIHIGKQDFDAFRIVMPPIEILNAFDDITAPMYEQIVNNIMENHRLSALRDTLLPRLMSGEIDVSEVEI